MVRDWARIFRGCCYGCPPPPVVFAAAAQWFAIRFRTGFFSVLISFKLRPKAHFCSEFDGQHHPHHYHTTATVCFPLPHQVTLDTEVACAHSPSATGLVIIFYFAEEGGNHSTILLKWWLQQSRCPDEATPALKLWSKRLCSS